MPKIDLKDRKLLYYLSKDCRMSNTQLAKKVGLSKNSIAYRIERLKKEGVIEFFATGINIGAFYHDTFTLFLKFNVDIYEEKKILEYFKNHPNVNWAATLSGQWDMFVEFVFKDGLQIGGLLNELIKRFEGKLGDHKLIYSADILRVEHLIEDVYKDLKLEPIEVRRKPTKKRHEIDATDKKILKVLAKESELPYLQIAKKTGLTIDIVRYRMKQMIDKNIIYSYFAEVNLDKLGYVQYIYRLKLKDITSDKLKKLKSYIRHKTNVTYAFFDLSNSSLVMNMAFKKHDEIDSFSRNLRKEFKEIIDFQEYILVKEHIKFDLFPDGLVE